MSILKSVAVSLAALGAFYLTSGAYAAYPERVVKIVVPYAAGGPTDIAGRLIAQQLSARLKQSFIVDNRAGAAGNIGAEIVAKSSADGYTLLVVGVAHAVNKSLYKRLAYDMQRDFTPVSLMTTAPLVLLANPEFPARSVADLVRLAKSKPGELSYASQGSGTAGHLAMEMLKSATETSLVHVPYRGSSPALADLAAGQVSVAFDSVVGAQPYIASGKLLALAVTGSQRSATLPNVPTMAESGFPMDASVWYGIVAPAGTPTEIVETLNKNIDEILRDPEVRERIAKLGAEPAPMTAEAFGKLIDTEIVKWEKVVKTSGAQVD